MKNILRYYVLIYLAIFLSCEGQNIDKLTSKGNNEMNANQYEKAIKTFSEVLSIDPNNDAAYLSRGLAKYHTYDLKGAIEDIKLALDIEKNGINYYHLGRMMEYAGDTTRAIQLYTLAINHDSLFFPAFNNRGLLYQKKKKYENAKVDFDMVLSIAPNSSAGYNNRGMLYQEMGNNVEAIKNFNEGINRQTEFSLLYYNKATSLVAIGQLDSAYNNLELALRYNPKNSYAYYDRGILNKHYGNNLKACQDWEKALELGYIEAQYFINKFCL